jgi:hypothetical protein
MTTFMPADAPLYRVPAEPEVDGITASYGIDRKAMTAAQRAGYLVESPSRIIGLRTGPAPPRTTDDGRKAA